MDGNDPALNSSIDSQDDQVSFSQDKHESNNQLPLPDDGDGDVSLSADGEPDPEEALNSVAADPPHPPSVSAVSVTSFPEVNGEDEGMGSETGFDGDDNEIEYSGEGGEGLEGDEGVSSSGPRWQFGGEEVDLTVEEQFESGVSSSGVVGPRSTVGFSDGVQRFSGSDRYNGDYGDDHDHDDGDGDGDGYAEDGMYEEYEEEEEEEELVLDVENNPLLARPQAALTKQLEEANRKLDVELRERREEMKRSKRERETLGVDLYAVQQQLAKLQMSLEKSHDEFTVIQRDRLSAEEEASRLNGDISEMASGVAEVRTKVELQQDLLQKTTYEVKQLEASVEETAKEISITQRATYKTEENVSALEKEKKAQDYIIDGLNEQIKRLHDKLALYQAQLLAQKQETRRAAETLTDAATEMQAIQFDKKNLSQSWNSTLVALARRDDALAEIEAEIARVGEAVVTAENETKAFKALMSKEAENQDKLAGILSKVSTEIRYLERQIKTIQDRREKLAEEHGAARAVQEELEKEVTRVTVSRNQMQTQLRQVRSERTKVANSVRAIEEEIEKRLSEQITLKKGSASTRKESSRIHAAIHEREADVSNLENELTRIDVDTLNTRAHNAALKTTLEALVEELKSKDRMIEQYELEIRRRHDELEKKQSEVDRLNRKYDALTSNMVDENLGPLEATIHNLTKAINEKGAESSKLQHIWVKKQTQLVNLVNKGEGLSDKVNLLKSQHTILTQKNMRLRNALGGHEDAIRGLKATVERLHKEMTKLNTKIAANTNLQDELAEGNLALENEFVSRLKEEERVAIRLEENIASIGQAKTQISADLVEAERQIMLWEKKIQLGKETAAALDPNVGAAETSMMSKEIHRMELRLTELQKRQEKLVGELEVAITRRQSIAARGRITDKSKSNITQAGLKKSISELSKKVKATGAETSRLEKDAKTLVKAQEGIGAQVEELSTECGDLRSQVTDSQRAIEEGLAQKQRNFETITLYQRMGKRYGSVLENKYREVRAGADLERDLTRSEDRTTKLASTVETLSSAAPEHGPALAQLSTYIQDHRNALDTSLGRAT